MQTQFREQNTKKATLERLVVETDLREERMGHELETHKRYYDTYKVSQAAENKQNLEKLRQGIIKYEKEIELSKKTTERNNAQKLQTKEIQVQKTMKSFEVELVEKKANTTTEIEKVVAARQF